jgi:hypothetical protein
VQALAAALGAKNISYPGEPEAGMVQTLLSSLLPVLQFIFLWMFLVRRMMGDKATATEVLDWPRTGERSVVTCLNVQQNPERKCT